MGDDAVVGPEDRDGTPVEQGRGAQSARVVFEIAQTQVAQGETVQIAGDRGKTEIRYLINVV